MKGNEKINTLRILFIVSLFCISGINFRSPQLAVADPMVSEQRNVGMFSYVDLRVSGNLYITQGENLVLELEGDRDLLEKCKTYVRNHQLIIENDSWRNLWSKKSIYVYVTIPEITGLELSGSGRIIGKSEIVSEKLGLKISGSGDVDLDVNVHALLTEISGSGDIQIRGKAKKHNCKISGSGDLKGYELSTDSSNIKISGSAKCEILVSHSLDAKISGSGKVYYRGNPSIVNLKTSGSGSIHKVE